MDLTAISQAWGIDLTPIIVAAIAVLGVAFTAWVAFRDFRLRRDVETTKQFELLIAHAYGRVAIGGEGRVTTGEQTAYICLLAALGKRHRSLRLAACHGLLSLVDMRLNDAKAEAKGQIAPDWPWLFERDQLAQEALRGLDRMPRTKGIDGPPGKEARAQVRSVLDARAAEKKTID
ncbi:hypothetical protein [Luteipulveratus mongoliensis]|uniref:Uncharacterized protein n=1 Tax=Luteipulveratus mongoliensis TaxID=571913 RepID=A0A0K1JIP2_9MICO|nr:hypothetical protein [Luteipulveratus mongoliensis]AKU16594.1 hypothetical protein VV02_13200 [Luteipulveratus mongoliensis]